MTMTAVNLTTDDNPVPKTATSPPIWITSRPEVVFTKGEGAWLWDSRGKRYLDFIQGWAVNCLGHCPPVVSKVLVEQSTALLNCSPAYYTPR